MTDRLTSERRNVELAPHDRAWAVMAASESARLAEAIGPTLVRVEHIGSTAIPGIEAKPIIDLMPVVRDLAVLDTRQAAVEALGYIWRGEFGLPGRRYCVLEKDGRRLAHVHCFLEGSEDVARHVEFRDYLLAHPAEARGYEAIKRAAAATHPTDMLAYNGHKDAWIKDRQASARSWVQAR